jgi:Lon protease-like protein
VSKNLEEIPLFPLHAVLLPYEPLQLHIFEPRYLEMVNYCVEYDAPFGIVLIREGTEIEGPAEPYLVGTVARIEKVQSYDDGRLLISVIGERRFRIRKIDESASYLRARIEPLMEFEPESYEVINALQLRLVQDFGFLVTQMLARPDFNIQVQLSEDPGVLTYTIARFLNLENPQKQRLLENTDVEQRLHDLVKMLEEKMIETKTQRFQKLTSQDLSEFINLN